MSKENQELQNKCKRWLLIVDHSYRTFFITFLGHHVIKNLPVHLALFSKNRKAELMMSNFRNKKAPSLRSHSNH
jgi:hypothetical protein